MDSPARRQKSDWGPSIRSSDTASYKQLLMLGYISEGIGVYNISEGEGTVRLLQYSKFSGLAAKGLRICNAGLNVFESGWALWVRLVGFCELLGHVSGTTLKNPKMHPPQNTTS